MQQMQRSRFSPDGVFSVLPAVFLGVGFILFFVSAVQATITLQNDSILVAVLDFVFVGSPALALISTGVWLPRSDITPAHYPRVTAWGVGGVIVMFGFIVLRDLHPGVTVEWSFGTQTIGLTVGTIGGLLIGIKETQSRVRAERLKQQEQELTRRNEQLEEFAGIVSHDLRNPLNVAELRLDLARDECDSDHLGDVANAHERMETLIEDLLTLAREGETVTDRQAVDLSSHITECWANVDTAGATLTVETSLTIHADETRLKQLFENLFRNAVEHGSDDVSVTVGEVADGFYVEDDCDGIPAEERDTVFETGHSTSDDGTGFGLSIVEQVAEAHGWTVAIRDGTDGGARFEFTGVT